MQSIRSKKLRKKDILVEKNIEGAWHCEAMVDGYLEWHNYYYFTKREAVDDFYRRYAA